MQAPQIASRLESFRARGAGTDSERRAALWLARELAQTGRQVAIETFWCRPNWPLAQAWHVALAIAGSLSAVSSPRLGGALLLAAAVFVVLDEALGVSPGRRLSPERASQNVVALAPDEDPARLRVLLTANYDAGRAGLMYRDALRTPVAAAQRVTGRLSLGWLAWLIVAIAWLEVIAVLRLDGHHAKAVSIAQLPPTIALVIALALLLELSSGSFSPGGGDNASGVGVAMALTRALDVTHHSQLVTDVVLTGAGDTGGIGLRRYLSTHRHELAPSRTAIIGIAACTAGRVHWWRSDGRLLPLLYSRELRRLARDVAAGASHLGARPRDGRGASPAFPARMARLPAIAVGCLDDRGLVPRSHQASDAAAAIDADAADRAVQFGLTLLDTIDATLAAAAGRQPLKSRSPTRA